uniref:F-box domain-containing protein n=1 Tax=Tetradesmus obliquus TaxID=3088 RepID=A0A383W269_TETOB|eukprot:jgi/Sobl393_1/8674/SZX70756.1
MLNSSSLQEQPSFQITTEVQRGAALHAHTYSSAPLAGISSASISHSPASSGAPAGALPVLPVLPVVACGQHGPCYPAAGCSRYSGLGSSSPLGHANGAAAAAAGDATHTQGPQSACCCCCCCCCIQPGSSCSACDAGQFEDSARGPSSTTSIGCGSDGTSISASCGGSSARGAHSSSSSPSGPATLLSSLPFEALAIIASLLERPERQALALSCTACRRAVAATATGLVLPAHFVGSAATAATAPVKQAAGQQAPHEAEQLLRRYVGVSNLRLTGCALCSGSARTAQQQHTAGVPDATGISQQQPSVALATAAMDIQQQQQQQQQSGAGVGMPGPAAAAAEDALPWVSPARRAAVREALALMLGLTPTAAAATAAAKAAGTAGGQQLLAPAAAAAAAVDWHQQQAVGCSASCQIRAAARAGDSSSSSAGLADFIAAAGPCLPYLAQLDLSSMCVHSLAGSSSSSSDVDCAEPGSLLAAIGAACPRLSVLHLPGWLWQGLGEIAAASADLACCSAAAATGTATLRTTPDAWAVPLLLQPYELRRAAGLQRALACERLASLAGLGQLRVLRLVGAPAPLDVLRQLSALSQLQVLAVNAACDMPLSAAAAAAAASVKDAHAAAAAAPGADAAAGSGVGEARPGTVMGTALVKLQRLSQLTLSGVSDAACASLGQLSGLASLTQLDIKDCRELRVAALGQLSALSNLRVLKVRRLPQLRAKARAALPLELTGLRALAALALDCDLHLRDIQVLSGMPQLTLLGAASLHCCVNPGYGICLPNVRHLALHTVPPLPAVPVQQQQPAAHGGGQQQHAAPAAPVAAAAGHAAALQQQQQQQLPAAVPFVQFVQQQVQQQQQQQRAAQQQPVQQQQQQALPQQIVWLFPAQAVQQQQQQQQQLMLATLHRLGPANPAAAGPAVLLNQGIVLHQQPISLAAAAAAVAAGTALPYQVVRIGTGQGLVPLQRQSLQQQLLAATAAAAGPLVFAPQQYQQIQQQPQQGAGLGWQAGLSGNLQAALNQAQLLLQLQQQHQQQLGYAVLLQQAAPAQLPVPAAAAPAAPPGNAAAAGAAAAAGCSRGWLAVLCPFLTDLLVGAVDSNVFSAVQGHPTLRRLVLGPGPQPASQLAAAAGPSVAAWGKLGTLPHLQSIKLSNTAGLMPGQDCSAALLGLSQASQLSLHQAGPFGDEHAWLLGSLFKRLQQLHLEGATALTDAGLAHLSFCPLLRLSLAGCPSVTVEGLRRLLLTCQSLQAVQLVGCTAVLPDQVEALQQAVWVVTGRRVELSWRSSKRGPGKQQHA